jgi:hypothetical protein
MTHLFRCHLATFVACAALSGCATSTDDCCKPEAKPGSKSGWTILFDGKSTDALRAYNQKSFPGKYWVLDGDALKTIPGEAVDIMTKEKYRDFELELEWKVAPGGNSGVMYRVAETDGESWFTGPEMQILDDERHPDGQNPLTTAGALYGLVAPNAKKKLKPVGEFNKAGITMKGNHVEHWLNGEKIVEYEWDSPVIKAAIAKSKFADKPRFMKEPEGHIVFQHHGQEFWIRNIRIRRL